MFGINYIMNYKAQGTVEYLVLVAVVVVIGLFIVYFSLNLFDSADVSNTSGKIGAKVGSGSISVLEAVVDDDSLLIVLSSLDPKGVELTRVSVDGIENNYNPAFFADARGFVLNELSQNCVCSSGQTSKTCSFQFTYITKNGSTQTTQPINVVVECIPNINTNNSNYVLTQDTTSPTITLLTPSNNDVVEENEVTFTFQASDDRNISSCTLFIDGEDVNTITNNFSSIKTTISTDGFYDWNISCTDTSNNTGNSTTRDLEIDASDYEINNCLELQGMQNDLSGDYILVSDIDCSETSEWNSGAGFEPIGDQNGHFFGSINGNGFSITNLRINRPCETASGLVGILGESGSLSSISVDGNVVGSVAVGLLVGVNYNGEIDSCSAVGDSGSAECVGQFMGGFSAMGGLVGVNYGVISSSSFDGVVTGDGYTVGGLVGVNGGEVDDEINTSYSKGIVFGATAGGLVGLNQGLVANSYSWSNVEGISYSGGLEGLNSGITSYSYSVGNVTEGNFFGGLVAEEFGLISSSFWDLNTSNQENSPAGIGKTTIEMMQELTFVDWDFTDIWEIDEGNSYPTLQWQSN